MVFSSVTFIFAFFPILYILYLALPWKNAKNAVLILGSLLFYAWGEGVYVLLMIASTLLNWLLGILIADRPKRAPLITAVGVIVNIGMLVVYKYTGLIAQTISFLPGVEIASPQIHLPIGISFFTFQALSYVIDVKRDPSMVQRNYFKLLLYISFFPQLIAGPIVKYHDIEKQLDTRTITIDGACTGVRRFMIGLAKKVLIADVMALAVDTIFADSALYGSSLCAWLGAVAYALQIYFDFSGYSDMAIGLGKLFGFEFMENFNYPYISGSIGEFWRRWHISLSTWFREYLYIPLGGNRKGQARTYLNLMIVFLATGVWHGAMYTFIVWGIFNGVLVLLERVLGTLFKNVRLKVVNHIYALLAIVVSFTIFRADSLGVAADYLGSMFSFSGGVSQALSFCTPYFLATLAVGILAATPVVKVIGNRLCGQGKAYTVLNAASYLAAAGLFLLCVAAMASNSYSPFIYFRF